MRLDNVETDREIEKLKWTLEDQFGWIRPADAKLTILIPVQTAMLGISLVIVPGSLLLLGRCPR